MSVLLPERVGRHSEEDACLSFREVERQLRELRRLDERDAVLGEQVMDHARVLHADERAQDAQHAGGEAEVEADAVRVSRSRAGARPDDHLVLADVLDELLDDREDGLASSIDEALPADLDDVGFRENGYRRGLPGLLEERFVGQRSLYEVLPELREDVRFHVTSHLFSS